MFATKMKSSQTDLCQARNGGLFNFLNRGGLYLSDFLGKKCYAHWLAHHWEGWSAGNLQAPKKGTEHLSMHMEWKFRVCFLQEEATLCAPRLLCGLAWCVETVGIYFETASLPNPKHTCSFSHSASGSAMISWMWILRKAGRMVHLQIPIMTKFKHF